MLYLHIIYEFLKIGFLAVGGGYATLPFLFHLGQTYNWFSAKELTQMIAVSCVTPGPVGMNVATYTGFKISGVLGSLTATAAIVIPSFVLVLVISKILKKFKDNFFVKASLYTLKPVSCAMIAAIGIKLFMNTIFNQGFDTSALILLLSLIALSIKSKKSPLFYLGFSAIVGILAHVIKSFIL